jgi:hypothetical protein
MGRTAPGIPSCRPRGALLAVWCYDLAQWAGGKAKQEFAACIKARFSIAGLSCLV